MLSNVIDGDVDWGEDRLTGVVGLEEGMDDDGVDFEEELRTPLVCTVALK